MLSRHENEIIQKELTMHGVKSVILIGSRSTGNFVKDGSDYDLYVITSMWSVPFIYYKIKEIEKILKENLGNKVTLEPLTIWRIKHGKDLLLFKTKNEGTIVFGKDYLHLIKIKSIDEILPDEFFSYLFSSLYFLIEYIDPVNNRSNTNDKLAYNIGKAIMYCAEIQLFIRGVYEKDGAKIAYKLSNELKLENENLNIVYSAREILMNTNQPVEDIKKLWFFANRYIILVFQQLGDRYLVSKNKQLIDLIEEYEEFNFSLKKNFQYLILCKIKKQGKSFFRIFKKKSIEKHLHCALFYLMLSLNEDMSINNKYLKKVYDTLFSIHLTDSYESLCDIKDNELWQRAKQIIFKNWSMACGKSII